MASISKYLVNELSASVFLSDWVNAEKGSRCELWVSGGKGLDLYPAKIFINCLYWANSQLSFLTGRMKNYRKAFSFSGQWED